RSDMAEAPSTSGAEPVTPRSLEYDPITGVPSEFNEFLPQESPEYKKWKIAQEGGEVIEKLTLKEKVGAEVEKLPGGKSKKKSKPQIIVSVAQRQKNKSTTTVAGLELFSVKLSEAGKLFGKKFACGASVVKTASGGEQIEMQGDFLPQIPDLLLKNYKNITKDDVFYIDMADGKKKKNYYADEDEDGEDAS
ncbi:Density-regulated, partial [Tetrabaena socialis]